ncbi:hypothetical protein, partial [Mesorhizobium sp. NBIMC_P2-C2]|uniref:hypothetical protein n=1 Tax=Mesorhizobium sp. NBIMC_P2-C2 TaxID=1320557 RepID=UPI0019554232
RDREPACLRDNRRREPDDPRSDDYDAGFGHQRMSARNFRILTYPLCMGLPADGNALFRVAAYKSIQKYKQYTKNI